MPNVFASVFIEALVGGGSWFTQSVRSDLFTPLAFGQVEFSMQRARINWLLPCRGNQTDTFLNLLENLSFEAGLRGSKFLLASADSDSEEFILLRRQGFCTYGWERYWRVDSSAIPVSLKGKLHWRRSKPQDQHDILLFQRSHLSHTVRAVYPLADEFLPEFIVKKDEAILGLADANFNGNRGLISYFLDSRIYNPLELMRELVAIQAEKHTEWYIHQQTGQDWLEEHLQALAQPAFARTELLVKHFTVREKLPVGILNHSTENSHPDPIAPYIHSSKT
jgi:hypothetical protein